MKALIICIDGGDPSYFETASTPNLDRLGAEGQRLLVKAQMPTVTNVNNVSLICGGPPAMHGITANYFLNPDTNEEVYMESGDFLLSPTLMEAGTAAGRKTAALASKKKLTDMIGKGADLTVTAEEPPGWRTARAGPQEEIYSAEGNFWLLRAARAVVEHGRGLARGHLEVAAQVLRGDRLVLAVDGKAVLLGIGRDGRDVGGRGQLEDLRDRGRVLRAREPAQGRGARVRCRVLTWRGGGWLVFRGIIGRDRVGRVDRITDPRHRVLTLLDAIALPPRLARKRADAPHAGARDQRHEGAACPRARRAR